MIKDNRRAKNRFGFAPWKCRNQRISQEGTGKKDFFGPADGMNCSNSVNCSKGWIGSGYRGS